jgi:acyl-CoA dehydrogenase
MYEDYFGEEHNIFRSSVRKFVEKEINPYIESWEEEEIFPVELYKKAADGGFLGLEFPEEYGGTPCDKFMFLTWVEEFIRVSGSTGVFSGLNTHTIASHPIRVLGTDEQKKRFLVPVLSGDKIAALGVTEPNAGSDAANIKTRAVRNGDFYIVNGSKTFITSGARANFITTAVRTGGPGSKGISILIVDSSTPGFTVSKKIHKMGWHCSDTAELSFVDCRIPVANLIGKEGDGFKGIMANFQSERLELAVEATATAERALGESIKYAKAREAFGTTISNFQVIRHKIVDMATMVEISREYNYRVATKMETGVDVTTEVSMAKIFACQVCDKVCYDAVQIHGGYGFTREYIVDRLYRDSRILSIGGGTTEIMKEILSKRLL